jgi:hypothetical protein
VHPAYTRVCLIYYYPSLVKEEREECRECRQCRQIRKVPREFPRKVSQNAYIAYTTYISWGLEVDYRLDTLPLHSARSAVLVNIRKFLQGFFKGISGLRLATDGLTVVAISLVQLRS